MAARQGGFTLVELMIVVVIIAILSGMAYPSYQRHILRSHRTAAQAEMMDIANRQQQFLLANRAYADMATLAASGYSVPAAVQERYVLNVVINAPGTPPSFNITMTPVAGSPQENDLDDLGNIAVLGLDNAGNKTPIEKWEH